MPRSGQSTFGPHSTVDEPNWDTERMAALAIPLIVSNGGFVGDCRRSPEN